MRVHEGGFLQGSLEFTEDQELHFLPGARSSAEVRLLDACGGSGHWQAARSLLPLPVPGAGRRKGSPG